MHKVYSISWQKWTSAELTQYSGCELWMEWIFNLTGMYCCMHAIAVMLQSHYWLTGSYYCMHAIVIMLQCHCCSAAVAATCHTLTLVLAAQLASAMGPWSSNFSPVDTAVCCCNTITLHTTIWCWCIWTSLTTTKCCKSRYLLFCWVLEVMNIIIISVITKCEASK